MKQNRIKRIITEKQKGKPCTHTLGDSTLKHVNGYEITEKLAVFNIDSLLLYSLRKASDDGGFHNCDEYKATSKRSLMNIKNFKDIRQKNLAKIVIGHLNINSIRQKFDSLIKDTTTNIDTHDIGNKIR